MYKRDGERRGVFHMSPGPDTAQSQMETAC